MRILGIVLLVLGVLGLAYGGFRYAWPEEVVDAGPLHVSVNKHHKVIVPPVAGIVCLVAGAGLLLAGGRRLEV